MYLEFFGLKEKPFSLTPDPRFLFLSESHRQALDHMIYGVQEREGFILIVGDIGTGKTTICRELLEKLDKNVASALILNPMLSEQELLEAILQDFGIPRQDSGTGERETPESRQIFNSLDPETQTALELNPLMPGERVLENILKRVEHPPVPRTKKEIIDRLNTYLLQRVEMGGNAVLILDEAQNLSPEVLEQIRILSNLETTKQKLLQIVLVGQLELKRKLEQPGLRQLNQRISIRYQLKPLSFDETKRYVEHRLFVAGSNSSITFTDEAYSEIFAYSRGVPRLVNLICERCLLGAYVDQVRKVDLELVQRCRSSLEGNLEDGEASSGDLGEILEYREAQRLDGTARTRAGRTPQEAVAQPWERKRSSWWTWIHNLSLGGKLLLAAFLAASLTFLWIGVRPQAEQAQEVPPIKQEARFATDELTPAVRLAFSIQLGAFQNLDDGLEQMRLLSEQGLEKSLYIVPLHIVQLGGRWYRLFYGGYPSRNAARQELETLVAKGIVKAGSARIVETPLAFHLGDYVGLEAAEEKRDQFMSRWRIPAYILLLEKREEAPVYRLYAGAFEAREQASFLADRLQQAELKGELVERLGYWPLK